MSDEVEHAQPTDRDALTDALAEPFAEALTDALNDLLAAESRGLAQHLDTTHPYLTAATWPLWARLRPLAAASREHARRLTQLLVDLNLPVWLRGFESDVARSHDLSLPALLPQLIEQKQRQIAACEDLLGQPGLPPAASAVLAAILHDNQAQLRELQALAAA